jgi:hypothetical protein
MKKDKQTFYIEVNNKIEKFFNFINEKKKNTLFFFLNKKTYKNFFFQDWVNKKKNISILNICRNLDQIIPHYCYHFNLSIAGNCRMCLVELSMVLKPMVSCALIIAPKMNISTNTELVKKAREGIAEFLLVNHPLDCPICDQGGECDLQDQSVAYGSHRGRFFHTKDIKRAVSEVMFNHFVEINLTRCIHCTRCVRFLNEIGGLSTFGMLGRGINSEISLYTKNTLISEIGSNITEYCPVGALTIKSYSLEERSWDEVYFETIDLSDSLCVPILIGTDGTKILKILPQFNQELEVSWITEETRFLMDGVKLQELYYPTQRILKKFVASKNIDNFIIYISWKKISLNLLKKIKEKRNFTLNYVIGGFIDLETILHIKISALVEGSNNLKSTVEANKTTQMNIINEDFDKNYIIKKNPNSSFNIIFLINLNLRLENAILNAKLRKKILWDKKMSIYYVGSKYNLTYKYIHFGLTMKTLFLLVLGSNFFFKLKKKNYFFTFYFSNSLLSCYKNVNYKLLFTEMYTYSNMLEINYLAKSANSVGILDLSLSRYIKTEKKVFLFKTSSSKEKIFFFFGSMNFKPNKWNEKKKKIAHLSCFSLNSHSEKNNQLIDYFLPTYSYFEKDFGYYINCFGILRSVRQVLLPRNFFAQSSIDILILLKKSLCKNKNQFVIKGVFEKIYSYIPLNLFLHRSFTKVYFSIYEKHIKFILFFFFVFSNKEKNHYTKNFLSLYSLNVNLLSEEHFRLTSNLKNVYKS